MTPPYMKGTLALCNYGKTGSVSTRNIILVIRVACDNIFIGKITALSGSKTAFAYENGDYIYVVRPYSKQLA